MDQSIQWNKLQTFSFSKEGRNNFIWKLFTKLDLKETLYKNGFLDSFHVNNASISGKSNIEQVNQQSGFSGYICKILTDSLSPVSYLR